MLHRAHSFKDNVVEGRFVIETDHKRAACQVENRSATRASHLAQADASPRNELQQRATASPGIAFAVETNVPLHFALGRIGKGCAQLLLAVLGAGMASCSSAPSSTVKAVVSDALAGQTVPTCPTGTAHPNVCCTGGPFMPAACTENIAAPFGACGTDALTFPGPTECCPLDGGACEVASTADGGSGGGTCSFLCGPGGYWPKQLADAAAVGLETCTPSTSTNEPCVFCCDPHEGCPTNQSSCGGPGDGCTGGLANLQCAACPAGWSVPASGQFDLCCRSDPNRRTECFSLSAQIASQLQRGRLSGVHGIDSSSARARSMSAPSIAGLIATMRSARIPSLSTSAPDKHDELRTVATSMSRRDAPSVAPPNGNK